MDFFSVIIERDTSSKIPLTVPEYEIPVLQAIHGESRVHIGEQVADPRPPADPPRGEFDPLVAFGALQRKYRQDSAALQHVYPTPRALAAAVGVAVEAPIGRRGGKKAAAQADGEI